MDSKCIYLSISVKFVYTKCRRGVFLLLAVGPQLLSSGATPSQQHEGVSTRM